MSASPAIRTVSAQVCRQCRKEQLRNTARWTSRRRFSSSRTPLASTSTATPATNFLNRLRFEVGQADPSLASTWRSLNAVHDEEPAKLSPDLVRQAIPILQKFRKPSSTFPKVSEGPQYREELTEEAEALYMRYRFVASRLRETGSEPQSVAQILYWLQGLKALSYAPAAWRIWKDALEEARRKDTLVAKQISTLVLVATAKWLFLLVEHTPSTAAIAEARKEADAILAYLEANGQVDGTIASLRIRIIKHSASYQEFAKAVKATFGLDLEMPCAPPGLALDGIIRAVDKHSHNSVLSALGKQKQFSTMVSVFETLAYPSEAPSAVYPVQMAEQNSFFSLSFDWFNKSRQPEEPLPPQDSASVDAAAESASEGLQKTEEVLTEDSAVEGSMIPAEDGHCPIMKIGALNTRTFELMIENALRGSSHGVARHYMLEMLEAWEQERQRLRAAYAELAAYRVPRPTSILGSSGGRRRARPNLAKMILQDPSRPSWERVWQTDTLGPAIGPSVHAIYRIYDELAGEWTSGLPWLKPLEELVKDVKRVLELVRDDLQFWTDVHDKQLSLAHAFKTLPQEQRSLHAGVEEHSDRIHSTGRDPDNLVGYQNLPFNTQLHLLILRKIEAELNDIHHEMHHRHRHTAAGQYVRSMLNELKGERKTLRSSRLVNAIRRSEAWCRADEAADEQRAEAIMSLNTLSYAKKDNQVQKMIRIAEGRRQAVRRAILRAEGTLMELKKRPEDEEEDEGPAQPFVQAVATRGLARQLRKPRVASPSSQSRNSAKMQTAEDTIESGEAEDTERTPTEPKARRVRVQLSGQDLGAQSSVATTPSGAPGALSDGSHQL